MLQQRTLARPITVTGIGIHSGKKVILKMKPAKASSGITFKRVDLENAPVLRASVSTVGATANNTSIGKGNNSVHTVEHLLAAFYGMGIDNVCCEIDGPEVPIMDGSGVSFIFLIKETGIEFLHETKKFMVILKTVKVKLEDKWAEIEPHSSLVIDSTIDFNHAVIASQRKVFKFSCENFANEISRARTFGLLRDVDRLKKMGLAKGGSLDNAIVLDDFKVLNREGLRFEDEFVRHKILDTIGDISLLGHSIAGKVTTHKSGHRLHNLLCIKLLSKKDNYEIVSSSSIEPEVCETFTLPSGLRPIRY